MAMKEIDQELSKGSKKPVKLVIDGIRNTAELHALRAYPNFYLISVQANEDLREQRILRAGDRCQTKEQFEVADTRDAEEGTANGQQVRQCNYLADIIVLNEQEISGDAPLLRQKYIAKKLYTEYIMLIEHIASGRRPLENRAGGDAAIMTAAYVMSRRSSCLKRKVGAVIASKEGDILSVGWNDVPESLKPCLEDPRYRWCARDVIQERLGQAIKCCPNCGEPVKIETKCMQCESDVREFTKRCPNSNCRGELELVYECPKCKVKVFTEYLAGASAEKTGKLMDLCRSLHAEENAILSLCRTGLRLPEGAILYSTTFPCNLCANKIVAMGIKTVVYAEPYTMKEAKKVFMDKGVEIRRFEGVKSNAFFRMYS
ncbi:MAG: hypothetical protein NTU53_08775 [Planctomycetota bacterium]|nr:hypothetical protein [Planctomycetota bacterium]